MSAHRAQRDMICRLLAELVEVDPQRTRQVLKRFQFKMADVSFMITDKGRFWTEVWHWPWDKEDFEYEEDKDGHGEVQEARTRVDSRRDPG